MAIPISTIPAVKAYLLTTFTTAAATIPPPAADETALMVQYGTPGRYMADEYVLVGDVKRTVEQYAMVGSGGQWALQERYQVEWWVDVWRGGDKAQYVEERAWTIAASMEQAIRNDPTLGGNVLSAWPLVYDSVSDWDEQGARRNTQIRCELECHAVL